jgi:uncharacterized membrane protein YfcA
LRDNVSLYIIRHNGENVTSKKQFFWNNNLTLAIILFILLGIAAGILAGLLGIGGGIIIVPGLSFILTFTGITDHKTMHIAAATSLCVMVFTTSSSTITYYRLGNILWDVFKRMVPGIIAGVILGVTAAHFLHSSILSVIFGVYLVFVSIKTLFGFGGKGSNKKRKLPKNKILLPLSALFGLISGMLGVGCGATCSPFLLWLNIEMKKVAGTVGAMSLPLAIVGAISVMLIGSAPANTPHTVGYLYWPAFLCLVPATMTFAPLGAKLSDKVPAKKLKKAFAILLLALAIKMLWI